MVDGSTRRHTHRWRQSRRHITLTGNITNTGTVATELARLAKVHQLETPELHRMDSADLVSENACHDYMSADPTILTRRERRAHFVWSKCMAKENQEWRGVHARRRHPASTTHALHHNDLRDMSCSAQICDLTSSSDDVRCTWCGSQDADCPLGCRCDFAMCTECLGLFLDSVNEPLRHGADWTDVKCPGRCQEPIDILSFVDTMAAWGSMDALDAELFLALAQTPVWEEYEDTRVANACQICFAEGATLIHRECCDQHYCRRCLIHLVKSRLAESWQSMSTYELFCPSYRCTSRLTPEEISDILPKPLVRRLLTRVVRDRESESLALVVEANKGNLTLDERPHDFLAWTFANTKACPHCHVRIEKNGGCPNMLCTRCRRSFNWNSVKNTHTIAKIRRRPVYAIVEQVLAPDTVCKIFPNGKPDKAVSVLIKGRSVLRLQQVGTEALVGEPTVVKSVKYAVEHSSVKRFGQGAVNKTIATSIFSAPA